MKIAIVGSGIGGLVAARLLHPHHQIVLFEAEDYLGGHTHTVNVEEDDGEIQVDTGFIVFNHRNYPLFTRLLDDLGVASQPSDMSFSAHDERTGVEYRSSSLNTLFAQRRNLFRPSFYRMVRDIFRFFSDARTARQAPEDATLGDYVRQQGYSRVFYESFIVPMASAIWSSDPSDIDRFPLRSLLEFYENHGLLGLRNQPQWRVVTGGSRVYVEAITTPFRDRIRLRTPVEAVRRTPAGVEIRTPRSGGETFDRVVLACHSDQALRLVQDPTRAEQEILGALRYQANDVVLHTDQRFMPRRRRAWASWNSRIRRDTGGRASVTYWMNRLQSLASRRDYFVTLNRNEDIAPQSVRGRFVYHHPIMDVPSMRARRRHDEINGGSRILYCGAYWGYGFHEDGVASAHRACASLAEAAV